MSGGVFGVGGWIGDRGDIGVAGMTVMVGMRLLGYLMVAVVTAARAGAQVGVESGMGYDEVLGGIFCGIVALRQSAV